MQPLPPRVPSDTTASAGDKNEFSRPGLVRRLVQAGALAALATLAACGGGNNNTPLNPASRTVSGTVVGLKGTGLVLQNNAGADLTIAAGSAGFAFSSAGTSGQPYAVTVKAQPSEPSQVCTVNKGSGTLGDADVTDVSIVCATQSFSVGGTVSGLKGAGLVLQNNAGDDVSVSADGRFTFATPVASSANYLVTVKAQPGSPSQTCSVGHATGKVGAAAINDVAVVCSTDTYAVSGTLSGLVGTGPVVLQNNAGDNLSIAASGAFSFPARVADGASYAVTVLTNPTTPAQTCSVTNATGTIGAAGVSNVNVVCALSAYTVGGTVSGLEASGLVLQNNGADDLTLNANGSFTFTTPVAAGGNYNVTVRTLPSALAHNCTVSNGTGSITSANVTNVAITCAVGYSRMAYVGLGSASATPGLVSYPIKADGTMDATAGDLIALASGVDSVAVNEAKRVVYASVGTSIHSFSIQPDGRLVGPAATAPNPNGSATMRMVPSRDGQYMGTIGPDGSFGVFSISADGLTLSNWYYTAASSHVGAPVALNDLSGLVAGFLFSNPGSNAITELLVDTPYSGYLYSRGTPGNYVATTTDPTGRRLYLTNASTGGLLTMDVSPTDGNLSNAATTAPWFPSNVKTMMFNRSGGGMLSLVLNSSSVWQVWYHDIDAATGAMSNSGYGTQVLSASAPQSMTLDASGTRIFVVVNEGVETKGMSPNQTLVLEHKASAALPGITSLALLNN